MYSGYIYTYILHLFLAPQNPHCTDTPLVNHLALPYLSTNIRRPHSPRPFSGVYTVDIPSSHITYITLLSLPFFDQPRSIREYLDRTHHVRRNGIDVWLLLSSMLSSVSLHTDFLSYALGRETILLTLFLAASAPCPPMASVQT